MSWMNKIGWSSVGVSTTLIILHAQSNNLIGHAFAIKTWVVAQHQQHENHVSREREEAPTPKGVEPFLH